MSVYGGPEMPDSGLLLYLDALNSKSYPGTGTTWFDLSGNANHFTMNGSLSHSYVNGFSGFSLANRFYRNSFPTGLKTSQGGAGYTTLVWMRPVITTGYQKIIGNGDEQGYIDLYLRPNSTQYHQEDGASLFYNDNISVANDTYSFTQNVWQLAGSTNSSGGTLTNPTDAFGIGSEGDAAYTYPFGGNIAAVIIYNRVLTSAEIIQVYNVTRSKFSTPSVPLAYVALHLDAANTTSYPGSGTTWSDISGNNFSATLTNGPVFNSSNSGSIVFDGTDDYAALPHTGLLNLGNEYSITAFIKLATTTQSMAPIFSTMDVNSGVTTNGVAFYWYKTSEYGMGANVLRLQQGASGWYWNVYASDNNSITDTNWHFVSLTVQNASTASPTITFNIDGVNKTSTFWNASNKGIHNYSSTTASIRAGSIYTASSPAYSQFYGAMNIANLRVYKRALTNQEIGTTFNALRDQFGI